MTKLKFKCELLSDVILNQKAASEGPNQTLDFIPGSNFLGIVAGQLYPKPEIAERKRVYMDDKAMKQARVMFHSDEVRFGDAHPAHGKNRSLRIPASLFFAKGEKEDERTHYVHHAITKEISAEILKSKIQLKQERNGFVDLMTTEKKIATRLKQQTSFAIKSAYDTDTRRSKDAQMFGYQSMDKGGIFYFSVEIDSCTVSADDIKGALVGIKHIGRSRSAQYGLVKISEYNDYQEVKSAEKSNNDTIVIYAESRLIFLDNYGMPTFQPSVEQLLEKEGSGMEIDWEKSQIRIFKYAPYNYVRKCFDTDRCGIEKGSVIVLKRKEDASVQKITLPRWIGSYRNEGFGKVIFNPPFLCAGADGKLTYKIKSAGQEDTKLKVADPKTPLTQYVLAQQQRDKLIGDIYEKVNRWVALYGEAFHGNAYASQWGNIRSIAMTCNDKEELLKDLFDYDKEKKAGGYLMHGVAKEKWESHLEDLMIFVQANTPEHVVNLASVMQKKCNESKKGGQSNE